MCRGWLVACILLTACVNTQYDLTLQPSTNGLRRELVVQPNATASQEEPLNEKDRETLERIALLYGQELPSSVEGRYVFSADFTGGKLPADVGGAAWYARWESPLGYTAVYSERFRGVDDLAVQLADRRAAAERLIDLLREWVAQQNSDQNVSSALSAFIDDQLRHDLDNFVLYVWTHQAACEADDANANCSALSSRLLHYAVERQYITPDELPAFYSAYEEAEADDWSPMLRLVRAALERKLELPPGTAAESMPPLATPAALVDSLGRLLRTTPEYRQLLQETRKAADAGDAETTPEPEQVLTLLLERAFWPNLLQSYDLVRVSMKIPPTVLGTNGNLENGHLRWKAHVEMPGDPPYTVLPPFSYAYWVEADEDYQRSHFGATIIDSELLAWYCLWYAGLSETEQTSWSTLISALGGREDLQQLLDEPTPAQDARGDVPAERWRKLLEQGMELLQEAYVRSAMEG